MKHAFASFLLVLIGFAAAPAPVHAQLLPQFQTEPLDSIVAVVDDDVVLKSELDQAVATVLSQYSGQDSQLPPRNVLEQQVLERLILQKLQIHRANDMGIQVTQNDVENAINGIAQQNRMSADQLRSAISSQGSSFGAFQQQVAEQIVVQKLRQQVLSTVQVTDSEIDNLMASPNFQAGQVHLAHIAISLPQGASADDIAKAQAHADEVEKALAGGMNFHAAAIRYSQAPDALEGGDLGWRSLDEVPPGFVAEVQKLAVGGVSPPLRGPDGFQILKLIEQRKNDSETVVTEYHARHILIRPTALLTEAQAHARADELRKRIVDGHEDFAKLAKEYSSDDTSANVGGDMGWFPIDAWGSSVAAQLQSLKDDEVSPVYSVGNGTWDIIQRLGTREQNRTAEVQRNRARQAIENRKAEDTYNNFLRDLKARAYIDNRLSDQRAEAGTAATP
ncbi:MAG TPA: peptidylprolyl isomerase [Rhodanobacteraceae bacterium]|nr:peptidylprolyl isomerase [Rhodanobacteraceae bacterium]